MRVNLIDWQVKRLAKLPRFRGWLPHLLCRGSEEELQRRKRELPRLNPRLPSIRSFCPRGWRSKENVAARVWPRRGPGSRLPQSHPLLLSFSALFMSSAFLLSLYFLSLVLLLKECTFWWGCLHMTSRMFWLFWFLIDHSFLEIYLIFLW